MPDEDSLLEEQIESSDSLQNGEEATGEKPGVEGRDKSKLIIPNILATLVHWTFKAESHSLLELIIVGAT